MQLDQLRRREPITLLGGAAALPLAARAHVDLGNTNFRAVQAERRYIRYCYIGAGRVAASI